MANTLESSLIYSSQNVSPQDLEQEKLLTLQSENINGKIKYFKAKKKHTLPKKFISSESDPIEDPSLHSLETIFSPESAKTVIRFRDTPTAPVALVLESNGTGYARYDLSRKCL